MAPRRPAVGDTVAHARFAQSGAAFGRHPTPDPTVAYGDEHPARLTGDEPFDAADVLEPALTLTGLPGGVVPGGLVVSQADDGDAAQRHVALPVAAFIKPVPVRPATGRGQRACAAELGERGLAPDAFGVIAGDDGQGRGDDDARAVHVGRRSRVLLEDRAHAFLQGAGLPFKRLPCLGGGFQCGRRAPLDQSAGGPALGEPVHAVPAPQSPVPFPDGLRGGDEQAVGRVGDRGHGRRQLGSLGVEMAQCLDPPIRAFRRACAPPAMTPRAAAAAPNEFAPYSNRRRHARFGQCADQSPISLRVGRECLGAQRLSPFRRAMRWCARPCGCRFPPTPLRLMTSSSSLSTSSGWPPQGLRRGQDVDGARCHGSCGIRWERPRSYEVMHPWPAGRRPWAGQIKIRTVARRMASVKSVVAAPAVMYHYRR